MGWRAQFNCKLCSLVRPCDCEPLTTDRSQEGLSHLQTGLQKYQPKVSHTELLSYPAHERLQLQIRVRGPLKAG